LPNEFATATVTEAAKSAHANVGGKSADQRMTRSGDRVVLPLWRSIELKNQTRLIENFDTGATDDVDTDRIARTTKTQSTSTDDLIYSTALDYSGHSPYSIGVAEATTILPWLRRANRSSGLMENDNSNPREKILNHLTTAKSTTDSHSGKPGQSTANLLTVMHAVQHDSHRSSSGGSGESGSAMFTTSAAFVRPRRPASSPLGSLLGSFDDEGQYPPARSQAGDNRGEQQLRRDKEQPRNSDDGDFYRQDEVKSSCLSLVLESNKIHYLHLNCPLFISVCITILNALRSLRCYNVIMSCRIEHLFQSTKT